VVARLSINLEILLLWQVVEEEGWT
jgi:hypothetical protein